MDNNDSSGNRPFFCDEGNRKSGLVVASSVVYNEKREEMGGPQNAKIQIWGKSDVDQI
jgi:hypothetical protein